MDIFSTAYDESPNRCFGNIRLSFVKTSLLLLMLLYIAADVSSLAATGMSLYWPIFIRGCVFLVIFLGLAFAIKRLHGDLCLEQGLYLVSIFIVGTLLSFVWMYSSVALQRPLVDRDLAAFDAALGFDWLAFYAWVMQHEDVKTLLSVVYHSFLPQMFFLTAFLCYRGQIARAWELSWLFWVTLFFCDALSSIWQAAGAYNYFQTALDTPYVLEYTALYHHSLRVIGATKSQGLIQFPSFHAESAVVFTYAARGIRVLFPALVLLNGLMLIALLPCGGHFLADMLAGVVLAGLVILTLRQCIRLWGQKA